MKKILFLAMLVLTVSSHAAIYQIDNDDSKVAFEIYKAKIAAMVPGEFEKFEGTFDFDDKALKLDKVNVKIDVASVDTDDAKRDGHLKSADFFEADKYKEMTFSSTAPAVFKNGKAEIKGKLTIRGVTQDVVLKATYQGVDEGKPTFAANTEIDRTKFGIKWNNTFDPADLSKLVLDNKVTVNLKVQGKSAN